MDVSINIMSMLKMIAFLLLYMLVGLIIVAVVVTV